MYFSHQKVSRMNFTCFIKNKTFSFTLFCFLSTLLTNILESYTLQFFKINQCFGTNVAPSRQGLLQIYDIYDLYKTTPTTTQAALMFFLKSSNKHDLQTLFATAENYHNKATSLKPTVREIPSLSRVNTLREVCLKLSKTPRLFLFCFPSYYTFKTQLKNLLVPSHLSSDFKSILSVLDAISDYYKHQAFLDNSSLAPMFAHHWQGASSQWIKLEEYMCWMSRVKELNTLENLSQIGLTYLTQGVPREKEADLEVLLAETHRYLEEYEYSVSLIIVLIQLFLFDLPNEGFMTKGKASPPLPPKIEGKKPSTSRQKISSLEEPTEDFNELAWYRSHLEKYPVLTREEELELYSRVAEGDMIAQHRFINSNLRLVLQLAQKIYHPSLQPQLELFDLVQEGNIALHKALKKFDPSRSCKFSTYATWWIRQAMSRLIADQSRVIRVPVHVHEKLTQAKTKSKNTVIIKQTQMDALRLIEQTESLESLNDELFMNQEYHLTRFQLEEAEIRQEDRVLYQQLNETFKKWFNTASNEDRRCLSPRQALVLWLRFGLTTIWGHPREFSQTIQQELQTIKLSITEQTLAKDFFGSTSWTLEEIGSLFGLTRERIRQIEAKALKKLLAKPELRSFARDL